MGSIEREAGSILEMVSLVGQTADRAVTRLFLNELVAVALSPREGSRELEECLAAPFRKRVKRLLDPQIVYCYSAPAPVASASPNIPSITFRNSPLSSSL